MLCHFHREVQAVLLFFTSSFHPCMCGQKQLPSTLCGLLQVDAQSLSYLLSQVSFSRREKKKAEPGRLFILCFHPLTKPVLKKGGCKYCIYHNKPYKDVPPALFRGLVLTFWPVLKKGGCKHCIYHNKPYKDAPPALFRGLVLTF